MKKFLTITLVIMIFVFTGCGNTTSSDADSTGSSVANNASNEQASNEEDFMSESTESSNAEEIFERIRLTFEGEEVIVNMYDNPTTRDFLTMLPLTLEFRDFANAEKVSSLPRNLSTEGAPDGYHPSVGDFMLYEPWAGLAIFYDDAPYAMGLVPMGHIDSGIEKLASMNEDFAVTIEVVE